MNLKIELITKVILVNAVAWFAVAASTHSSATGLTDRESAQCVSAAMQIGNDVMTCVETTLAACSPPDWFPVDESPDEFTSTPLSATTRDNEAEYDSGSYSHFEHDWYSSAGVPLGPALPRIGHTWNQYAGSALIKSVTCDQTGTWAFP